MIYDKNGSERKEPFWVGFGAINLVVHYSVFSARLNSLAQNFNEKSNGANMAENRSPDSERRLSDFFKHSSRRWTIN